MKKVILGLLMVGVLVSGFMVSGAMAVDYSKFPPPAGAKEGLAYSPRNFTATLWTGTSTFEWFPSNRLILSGGNTANYVTAEVERVTVFSNVDNRPARIYIPQYNNMHYNYPTLEVVGVTFKPTTESFRVEFIDSDTASSGEASGRLGASTTVQTISFARTPKSISVVNHDTTTILKIDIGNMVTFEVDPAIGSEKEIKDANINSIDIYTTTGTASFSVEVLN